MSTERQTGRQTRALRGNWTAGAVGGIVGAFGMGLLMLAMNADVIAVAIPSLYALTPPPNVPLGMGVHLFHGAVLGIVFAGLVGALDVRSTGRVVGLGLAWGVLTWIVFAALLMPVWLSAAGSPADPPFPNFAPPSLLWHLVYGLLLGGVYAATEDRF
jgi:hypothetical protein